MAKKRALQSFVLGGKASSDLGATRKSIKQAESTLFAVDGKLKKIVSLLEDLKELMKKKKS